MNEHSTTIIPGASKYVPHIETAVEDRTMEQLMREAADAAAKQSTNPSKE